MLVNGDMLLVLFLFSSFVYSSFCDLSLGYVKLSTDLINRTSLSFVNNFNEYFIANLYKNKDDFSFKIFLETYDFFMEQKLYDVNRHTVLKSLSHSEPQDFIYAFNYWGQVYFRDKLETKNILKAFEMGNFSQYASRYKKDFLNILDMANNSSDQRFYSLITNVKNNLYRPEESIVYMYKVWNDIVKQIEIKPRTTIQDLLEFIGLSLNKLVVMYPNLGQLEVNRRAAEVGIARRVSYYTLGGFQYKGYADRFIKNQEAFKENILFTGSIEERGINIQLIDNKVNQFFARLSEQELFKLRKEVSETLSFNLSTRIDVDTDFKVYVKFLEKGKKLIPLTTTVVFDKLINKVDDVDINLIWIHTSPEYVLDVLQEAQDVFAKLQSDQNLSKREKLKLIAKIHYLTVEALPFMRGSALGADILSKALMLKFDLEIKNWKGNIFPDLEAIISPNIESYENNYKNLFN